MVTEPALDQLDPAAVIDRLLDAEQRVLPVVRAAGPAIAAAAARLATVILGGGRVAFAGAGTSGRLAVAEASELPGTFGLPGGVIAARVAGGGQHGPGGTDEGEDDEAAGRRDANELALGPGDVLVAVAASGRTPYTLALAGTARTGGTAVVAVVNVVGSPLGELAAITVELPVGEEVLRGSTRLSAGTAQKVALNAITTAAMARAGRVHGDLMVDVVAANEKLRDRAAGIVAEITARPPGEARAALERCGWNARAAVLHLSAGLEPSAAADRAARHVTLRAALRES